MSDYQMLARKRDWVPAWLWRLACIGGLVLHHPLRGWLTEPVAYEEGGAWWIDE